MIAKGDAVMKNRLRQLRKEAGVTLRELHKYTGIVNSVISNLENGTRKFRQSHIDALSSFFNVTSDYLLGRTDYGLIVRPQIGDEEFVLTEKEYDKLKDYITVEVIVLGTSTNALQETDTENKVIIPKYVVYRELKGEISNYDMQETLNAKLLELTKRLTSDDLRKTINFIENYILK